MSNEAQNKLPGWRSRLDELKRLEGETAFENTVLWERLYERMNHNRRHKKATWYWLAAAIFFVAVIASVYFMGSTSHESKSNSEKQVVKESPRINKSPVVTPGRRDLPIATVEKVVAISNKKPDKKVGKSRSEKQSLLLRVFDTVSSVTSINATWKDSIAMLGSPGSLAVTSPSRKKLKVVHINELGDATPLSLQGPNVSLHYFNIKFANMEVYQNSSSSKITGIPILKLNAP